MKKKIFIIHGMGVSLDETLQKIILVLNSKIYVKNNDYYINDEIGKFIRYIIYEDHDNDFMKRLEEIFISKLIIANYYQEKNQELNNFEGLMKISAFMIEQKLKNYNPGVTKSGQLEFCETTYKTAVKKLIELCGFSGETNDDLLKGFETFLKAIVKEDGTKLTEKNAFSEIKSLVVNNFGKEKEVQQGLEESKKILEAGGDLDTVGSNALYGAWADNSIKKEEGRDAQYGKDYEYTFINYHDDFTKLAKYENCDIYLPDFPIDAIPNLTAAADALEKVNSKIIRIDDHHPWSEERKQELVSLKEQKKIEHFALSGPSQGEEQPKEEQKCGTDMIYEQLIKGAPADNPGLEELTRLAHVQDLHIIEDELAINISKIIGSKHSKIEMCQELKNVRTKEDMQNILISTGWSEKLEIYEKKLAEAMPKLEKNIGEIVFVKNTGNLNDYYEKCLKGRKKKLTDIIRKITFNLIDLTKLFFKMDSSNQHRIIVALSPFQKAKESKINVAAAINHLSEKIKHMDYFFYCYGADLMTTRKVNGEDNTIDLNMFLQFLGTKDDGGHSEAATGKPSQNPSFPKERFKKVNYYNFENWLEYLAQKISEKFDYKIVKTGKISVNSPKK